MWSPLSQSIVFKPVRPLKVCNPVSLVSGNVNMSRSAVFKTFVSRQGQEKEKE